MQTRHLGRFRQHALFSAGDKTTVSQNHRLTTMNFSETIRVSVRKSELQAESRSYRPKVRATRSSTPKIQPGSPRIGACFSLHGVLALPTTFWNSPEVRHFSPYLPCEISQAKFSAISIVFPQILVDLQSISIDFLSFSITFSQHQSTSINFNQFQSV